MRVCASSTATSWGWGAGGTLGLYGLVMNFRFDAAIMAAPDRPSQPPLPSQPGRAPEPFREAVAARVLERRRGRAPVAGPPQAGAVAAGVLSPLLRDAGIGLTDLKRHWAEIVGERLAGLTLPEKLAAGVLTVRAHASAAPFVQHQSALILERARLSGAQLTALAIRQGAIPRAASNVAAVTAPLSAEEESVLAAALAGVADGALKAALLRLGRAIAAG